MKKIISLFKRDFAGNPALVTRDVTEGAEWVLAGEGRATRKWDGTACLVKDGKLYKRFDAKNGKTPPVDFISAQDPDPITKHWPGWIPVDPAKPEDKWHVEAFSRREYDDGTYELCGPKINANPEGFLYHDLVWHGSGFLAGVPTDYDALRQYLEVWKIEGIVWHHPDGRMVKIKARDFGIQWPRL